MEFPSPYLFGERKSSNDCDSFAPSESDCSTLIDLKKRVKELDCLLNDLSGSTSSPTPMSDDEEEYNLDSYGDKDDGIGDDEKHLANFDSYDEEHGVPQISSELTPGRCEDRTSIIKSDGDDDDSVKEKLGVVPVDMVHTLSSLFLREEPTSSIHRKLQKQFGDGGDSDETEISCMDTAPTMATSDSVVDVVPSSYFKKGKVPTIELDNNHHRQIQEHSDRREDEKRHSTMLCLGRLVLLWFGILSLGIIVTYVLLRLGVVSI